MRHGRRCRGTIASRDKRQRLFGISRSSGRSFTPLVGLMWTHSCLGFVASRTSCVITWSQDHLIARNRGLSLASDGTYRRTGSSDLVRSALGPTKNRLGFCCGTRGQNNAPIEGRACDNPTSSCVETGVVTLMFEAISVANVSDTPPPARACGPKWCTLPLWKYSVIPFQCAHSVSSTAPEDDVH